MKFDTRIFTSFPLFTLILWVLVILLLVASIDLIQAQEDPPLIHSGKQHLLQGEPDQAIINFSEHIKQFGFDKDAYYWRAHCLIKQGYYVEAMKDLDMALQYYPEDSRSMDAMGYAHNQQGNYLEAINWFNKAQVLDPENAIIYNNRGMSYYYLEKYPSAFHDFNKAVRLDSTFAEAYSNRGSARYNNQNIAEATDIDLLKAEEDFSRAIELDNTLLSAYRNRGIVRFNLEKFKECFLDLQKAIYLNPEDPIVYYHMGNLMMARQQYPEAVTYYNECLARDIKMKEAVYARALAHIELEDLEEARFDYSILMENFQGESGTGFYLLARTYAMEDDRKMAYTYLKQARKYGYFKSAANRSAAWKDTLFVNYWKEDPDFERLREKIEKN